MSKKLFALVLSLAMVMTMGLAGCSSQNGDTSKAPEGSTAGTEPAAGGAVYYLNFKPEQNDDW